MMVKTVCPPDCPSRHAGCGATCEKFLLDYEKKTQRYAKQAEQRKLDELTEKAVRERMRQMRRKQKQI